MFLKKYFQGTYWYQKLEWNRANLYIYILENWLAERKKYKPKEYKNFILKSKPLQAHQFCVSKTHAVKVLEGSNNRCRCGQGGK